MLRTDPETIASINQLKQIVSKSNKPLVIWIGAGASRWAGLPSWQDLAKQVMRVTIRMSAKLDVSHAQEVLKKENYPLVFELCRNADESLYNSELIQRLSSPALGPVYSTLLSKLVEFDPCFIVTTNADTLLEQHLPKAQVIENSDLEGLIALVQDNRSFIGKLHGSISTISSLVFTSSDYDKLKNNRSYIDNLRLILASYSVLFLGYGAGDEYLIKLIEEIDNSKPLFGDGPHFIVTSSDKEFFKSIKPIRFDSGHHADQRTALRVLDVIKQHRAFVENVILDQSDAEVREDRSAFFISDFLPVGKHEVSQSIETSSNTGKQTRMTVGLGWQLGELPTSESHALHDLVVGLLCFDKTYLPLRAAGLLNQSIGQHRFEALLKESALGFIHQESEPAVVFPTDSPVGEVVSITGRGPTGNAPMSPLDWLHRLFNPGHAGVDAYEKTLCGIASSTDIFTSLQGNRVPAMTKSSLLMPKVLGLLGFGEGLVPSMAPEWLKFPLLRLAHIVQASCVCQEMGIPATRLPFGGSSLVSAAFGINVADEYTDYYASYVLTSRFTQSMEGFVETNPDVLFSILKFRDTQAGIDLRREVLEALRKDEGSEFSTCLDAGIEKGLSKSLLDRARSHFDGLMFAGNAGSPTPAVWGQTESEAIMTRWRSRSREIFLDLLRTTGRKTTDECLCGSGEIARLCCFPALRS